MSDYIYTTEQEAIEGYNTMIDECYSFEKVGGIFAYMQPSRVLKECDPIAYCCGFLDWLDALICNGDVPENAENWDIG